MNIKNIGIVILAAGASSRLGSPKQLLKLEGKTLLERITGTAILTGFETVVVLGAKANEIGKSIKDLAVEIVLNENWESGLSSSIKTGLNKLIEINPSLSAVVLLLCDQPFITKDTISRLVRTQIESGKSIVASRYSKTVGTPALFTKKVFEELLILRGDRGAKVLIEKYRDDDLSVVTTPEAAIDIDTKEDFERLTEAQALGRNSK